VSGAGRLASPSCAQILHTIKIGVDRRAQAVAWGLARGF
jgi:hypothetical protein